ncbi:MAG: PAS domain S-box protein [Pseudomonadota bacterium]
MSSNNTIKELWGSASTARLFESSGLGFLIVSPEQNFLDVSRTFCEKTGYSKEELLKLNASALTHPDDLELTRELFQDLWEQDHIYTTDKRFIKKDGKTLWCKLRSEAVRDESGKVICRIAMVEDITKAKSDEILLQQMATITEASDDAIFRANTAHIIDFWGKGAERLYGYTAQEAIGQHISVLNTIDDHHKAEVSVKLQRGEVAVITSTKGRHKNNHEIHISVLAFPIRNKSNEIIAYAAVHRDIGDIKQLEAQLLHSQRMETAGLLAGGIAHDFNNLLTVIQGSCNLLQEEVPAGSSFANHLEQIEHSADRASQLTRQLLAFSRKQNGSPIMIDPNELLAKSVTMLNRTLGDNVELTTSFQSSACVMMDPMQLEQILLNLAVNARHAMPKGGSLKIGTRDVVFSAGSPLQSTNKIHYMPKPLAPGRYVLLTVADSGTGMSKATLEHIFDPFFTTKPKGEGTGLGLSVVYGLITQLGGGISVVTEQDHGTTFHIYLPLTEGAALIVPQKAAVACARGKGKILIVEDDDGVRSLTTLLLEAGGYQVFKASSPSQVLNGTVETNVDLILSDVMMPGMSGPEFSELWLARHPDAKFLFMSGYFDEDIHSRKMFGNNLLQKPFKPADLLRKVQEMMTRI